MRYAIISDIHGNLRALEAVLYDAEGRNIDHYLFLGDYYADFPYPNEVAARIRSIPNARAVRGNKEDYLIELSIEDQSKWIYDQLAGLHWNYRALTPENLAYYMNLPKTLTIGSPAGPIEMMHASSQLFHGTSLGKIRSSTYANLLRDERFTRAGYIGETARMLRADGELRDALARQRGKIFLFGHNHLQWHAQAHGAHFIDPGSCGMPLDGDARAAYTILEIGGRDQIAVDERRVEYDIPRAKAEIRAWEAYRVAPVWYDIVLKDIDTATDYVNRFFEIARQVADAAGKPEQPYANEIWNEAGRAWRAWCELEGRA